MKQVLLICAFAATAALPAKAEEETPPSLMEQGFELFFEGLRQEMEPALGDLLGLADEFGPAMMSFFEEMGPALAELVEEVQDWSAYEAPEILPNGDIIIRKKPENPEPQPKLPEEVPEGLTDI